MNTTPRKSREKGSVSENAFLYLPTAVASKVPGSRRGGLRVDAALLSGLAFQKKRFDYLMGIGGERAPKIGPHEIKVAKGEFACSVLSVAESLWRRWTFLPETEPGFDPFYKSLQRSALRLIEQGWVTRVRSVSPTSAAWGTIWKISEQVDTDALPRLPRVVASVPTQSRRYRPLDGAPPPGDLINVVDDLGRHFLSDHPQLYTQAEARFDTRQAGFEVNYLSWVKTVGKGAAGSRYSSSGSWRAVDYQRREYAPTFFYWISLDVDRAYFPEDAWEATRNIAETIGLWGADLERIVVSYTGGRGFHVRIPAGMAGNPIFSSPSSARRVLSKFAHLLTGGEEVDECVFDPRQQLRMIGSRHDSSGLYCNAFSGKEFLAFASFWEVVEACSNGRFYEPFDPRLEIECPSLIDLMLEASEMASAPTAARLPVHGEHYRLLPDPENWSDRGSVIKAALEGCARSEVWHEPRGERVFEGRSKLLFVAACEMLRRHGLGSDAAWLGLCEVNDLCTPPLSQTDLKHRYRSAIRSVERELSIKQGGGKPR